MRIIPHRRSEFCEWPGVGPQLVVRIRWWDWIGRRRWFERARLEP